MFAPSSDQLSLKMSLLHLPTKAWSEDGVLVLRQGRLEAEADGRTMINSPHLKSSPYTEFAPNVVV